VVAQAAGVYRVGHEIGSQAVHFQFRGQTGRVAEVVAEFALGQAGRRLGLAGRDRDLLAALRNNRPKSSSRELKP
jgi:hypothetical protein